MPIKSNLPSLSPARERHAVTIDLPSKGYVCKEAFPNGLLKVYPWTPEMDDWIVKRAGVPSAVKTVIHDALPHLCDLGTCNPDKFLVSEALLVWLVSRSIKNDCKVQIDTACPACGHSAVLTVIIPDNLERKDKAEGYKGYDTIHLPNANDDVNVSPLSLGMSRSVVTRPAEAVRAYSDVVATLAASIRTVNDSKPDSLVEACTYVTALSPADYEALRAFVDDNTPGVDTRLSIECDECKHVYKHTLKLSETFFR